MELNYLHMIYVNQFINIEHTFLQNFTTRGVHINTSKSHVRERFKSFIVKEK